MDIYFNSVMSPCNEYRPRQKEPITVVISPLRVEGTELKLRVVTGCNHWESCQNERCYFSKAARDKSGLKGIKKTAPNRGGLT